jgi:DNA repair exonuclease SbcCD ATPase subunit
VNKSQELARLTEAGRQLKSRINEQKRRNSDLETEAYKIDTRISVTRAGIQVHQEEVAKLDQAALARPATPEYIALTKRKRQIEDAVTILQAGGKADTSEIDAQIANLDKQIAAVEAALAQIKQRQQLLARIEQLRAEQRTLAAQLEQVEKVLYLLDAFTRAKVAMLDSRINSRFSMARFKLFEQLVNGGVEPCCETLYQGVPWGGGLNNGAQIAVGLDIISTLAAHYKVSAPVWIDNREGALHLPKIAAQTISLYVSGPDKTLRVVQA